MPEAISLIEMDRAEKTAVGFKVEALRTAAAGFSERGFHEFAALPATAQRWRDRHLGQLVGAWTNRHQRETAHRRTVALGHDDRAAA